MSCIIYIIPSFFLPTIIKWAFIFLVALARGREQKGSDLLLFTLITIFLWGPKWSLASQIRKYSKVSPSYLNARSLLYHDCLWAGVPAAIGRCAHSTGMWIHTFFHISDLLEQPPWDISSWVVDVQVLFYPSDITVSALVPCMVYGVPGHVLLVIATTL